MLMQQLVRCRRCCNEQKQGAFSPIQVIAAGPVQELPAPLESFCGVRTPRDFAHLLAAGFLRIIQKCVREFRIVLYAIFHGCTTDVDWRLEGKWQPLDGAHTGHEHTYCIEDDQTNRIQLGSIKIVQTNTKT
jgi:hypothetical protein